MNNKAQLAIVGAQKAGTTSLKNYLSKHPAIATHPQTEFAYFAVDKEYEKGWNWAVQHYLGHVPDQSSIVIKNVAIAYTKQALERLKDHNPHCQIVMILREPVSRAVSSYQMGVSDGWLTSDFDDIFTAIDSYQSTGEENQLYRNLVKLGEYAKHLDLIYQYFPADQVDVILFDELKSKPKQITTHVLSKLGLDVGDIQAFDPAVKAHNKSGKPRSEVMTKALHWLRQEENPVKKIVKSILPYQAFTKLGDSLRDMNKSNQSQQPIPIESKKRLYDYYRLFNDRLKNDFGLDITPWEQSEYAVNDHNE